MSPNEYGLSKAAYSVTEALSLLPLGRNSLYNAINRGDLRATKYGKKTLFTAPDLAAFLDKLRSSSPAHKGAE